MATRAVRGEAQAGLGEGATSPFPALQLVAIEKSFGAVRANRDVNLRVEAGTIHGLIGENGAGKSTLMSILYGFYQADSGRIEVLGQNVQIKSSDDAIALGIGMVHQHFMLVENFTVLENVVLGAESGQLLGPSLSKARRELEALEKDYGLAVDPDAVVEDLPVGKRQRVEILKALFRGAKILILDEPTGVLTPQESEQLFRILVALKEQGVTVLLITHKLQEIMAVTDRVSVMRGGELVATRETAGTTREELAELMVGRKVLLEISKKPAKPGEPLLVVENLSYVDASGVSRVRDLSFTLRAGEIVGIAGVSGNGQSELLEVLAGIHPPSSGSFSLMGHRVSPETPTNPAVMRARKLAHIPEDRQLLGIVKRFPAYENAILGYHEADQFAGSGPAGRFLLDYKKVRSTCLKLMESFDVRPVDPELKMANFSGGNQQKLILAREFSHDPQVLLVGQPTRGVDIGAIEFIHRRLLELRDAGAAILLVSVELEEIMSLSDRILVMSCGLLTGELTPSEADAKSLGLLMSASWVRKGLEEDVLFRPLMEGNTPMEALS